MSVLSKIFFIARYNGFVYFSFILGNYNFCKKIVIGLRVVQFCLQLLLIKVNRIRAQYGTDPLLFITGNDFRSTELDSTQSYYHYLQFN